VSERPSRLGHLTVSAGSLTSAASSGWRIGVRNWVLVVLMVAGLAVRVTAQLSYHPALLYIDSIKYLYNAYPGADPVGYKAPLRAILAIGNLGTVTAVQHLLGLAIAATIYIVLIHWDVPRWLGAIAVAPLLLDAYQVQIEQNIMPDVWFEAVIVAGIAVLLARRAGPKLGAVITAGVLLGASATVRQVGEILILPALLFVLAAGCGWRTVLTRALAMVSGFAIPVVGYMTGSLLVSDHFWLATATPSVSTYGRMAVAADCATLKIPAYKRPLCPTPEQRAHGVDWLDHHKGSPVKTYVAPPGMNRYAVIASFDHQVLVQQPGRVLVAIAADGLKLFSLTRTSSQVGTPISRWQFQDYYPTFPDWVTLGNEHRIVFGLRLQPGGPIVTRHRLEPAYGGPASVSKGSAAFLRAYQLHGGYAPGPMMAVFAIAGLAGSLLVLVRPASPKRRKLARACLLFFGAGAAVLIASDAFQFSWRYQMPSLITLPPAGVLGITVLVSYLRKRRDAGDAAEPTDATELASPAV
jgi:hypothetical protein